MKKYTDKEIAAMRDAARKYQEKTEQQRAKSFSKLWGKTLNFAKDIQYGTTSSELYQDLVRGLAEGDYKNPSDFIEKKAKKLFSTGWIYPGRKKYVCYAADHACEWIYEQRNAYRRAFRTRNKKVVADLVMGILRYYVQRDCLDAEIIDIMKDNLSEEQLAYKYGNRMNGYDEIGLACEIDAGNEQYISLLTDILVDDSEIALDYSVIRAVLKSHNTKLHELLGKYLLAARLQEGLRQAICENADCGTVEGFLAVIKVIAENDLIRFSSVKRAVGTWLGLLADPYMTKATDLERISQKSIELVYECLCNPVRREEYLGGEDSMKMYTALWSLGVYEVQDVITRIRQLATEGTHHQILTAGYAAQNFCSPEFEHTVAKTILTDCSDKQDILAVYMPCFMGKADRYVINVLRPQQGDSVYLRRENRDYSVRKYVDYRVFFASLGEAESYYHLLWKIYDSIRGKSVDFSPCIFPWHSASLRKGDIAYKLAFLASALQDNAKIDEVVPLLAEIDATYGDRGRAVELLLIQPETEAQRRALVESVCDKESYTRGIAYKIAELAAFGPDDYLLLEDMLKYKNAEMRANIIKLLYKQPDAMLCDTIARLMADKKEEKRTGALDIIMQLSKDEKRWELYQKCRGFAVVSEHTTTKEKILIEEIQGTLAEEESNLASFYGEDASYVAVVDSQYLAKAKEVFGRYFYHQKVSAGAQDFDVIIHKLSELVGRHRDEEYTDAWGEVRLLGDQRFLYTLYPGEETRQIVFRDLWQEFYRTEIKSPVLLFRAYVAFLSEGTHSDYAKYCGSILGRIIGAEFLCDVGLPYMGVMQEVLRYLLELYMDATDREYIAAYVAESLLKMTDSLLVKTTIYERQIQASMLSHYQFSFLLTPLNHFTGENMKFLFPIQYKLQQMKGFMKADHFYGHAYHFIVEPCVKMDTKTYIKAAMQKIIDKDYLYKVLFGQDSETLEATGITLSDALETITSVVSGVRELNAPVTSRQRHYTAYRTECILRSFVGEKSPAEYTEADKELLGVVEKLYGDIVETVLAKELRRGDSETEFSKSISQIKRIYGVEKYVAILAALGRDTLDRSGYYYGTEVSKKHNLSHLLGVCIPNAEDDATKLRELVKNTDITETRLIEAALYSPEWLEITEQYLQWDGFGAACYYFMAHMNESHDEKRKAIIAKYTPIPTEELQAGAFDIAWFRSAYEILGKKRFDAVYRAAKYISDGAKHSRARKYADAVMGNLHREETKQTIGDKRNKDLLMAYALIPLADEDDLCERYLYLQQFLKESKQFGAQRSASEKAAVAIAMQNLALNAGMTDVTRLALRMETKLVEDSRELFDSKGIDEITVRLFVDGEGKASIICTKAGKELKAVPAKYKKDAYIVKLTETKKKLAEQYSRTKKMFEEAMEDAVAFTKEELDVLCNNPVAGPLVKKLVFVSGETKGFLCEEGLMDYAGSIVNLSPEETVLVAHPYMLYKDGNWQDYQKLLFEKGVVQPFKQVFRELYVKTEEELQQRYSLRYAGHQIQPIKAKACLKTRRWVADVEDGLQKVYYKENIVARIYARADWFSPSDIEAPTLEWVEFSNRKTGAWLTIAEIPDIIFSEVMRDVDLAVSVAHAGGVDPETSHSTIEMRTALLQLTKQLFRLTNITIQGSHAHIEGKRADYSLHLGSGVVHQKGGTMINILPVHSQHRGKLFLPFADDDPKSAEIITKALFLAQDDKIKDPSILSQLN